MVGRSTSTTLPSRTYTYNWATDCFNKAADTTCPSYTLPRSGSSTYTAKPSDTSTQAPGTPGGSPSYITTQITTTIIIPTPSDMNVLTTTTTTTAHFSKHAGGAVSRSIIRLVVIEQ